MGRSSHRSRKGGRSHGGDGNANTLKYIIIGIGVIALAAVVYYLTRPADKHRIDDVHNVEVQEVIDGNTIKLKNGLTVKILGVNNTSKARSFLQDNLKGKFVSLRADTKDVSPTYQDASRDVVRAYVNTSGTSFNNVNGYMLINGLSDVNLSYCQDSVETYKMYASNMIGSKDGDEVSTGNAGKKILLSKIDLGKKMTPASFLMLGLTRDSNIVIGTGFFINDRGLALTNHHIIKEADEWQIYFPNEDGEISTANGHPMGRVLATSRKDDYAIFTVVLDNGEKVPYLPICTQAPERGEAVAAVGNPSKRGNIYFCTYSTGSITALRPDAHEIQVDISLTNGNSGGPICNYYGEVMGIVKSVALDDNGHQNAANINFGVDIRVVRETLDELIKEKISIAEYSTLEN